MQALFPLVLALAFVLLSASCGKRMDPISPDKVLPGPVRQFRLTQEGDSLRLSWLLPRENQLGQVLTQMQGCRIFRAEIRGVEREAVCPTNFFPLADIDLAYPKVGEVRGESLAYQDRDLVPDRRYCYRVAAYDPEGYLGAWSEVLSHSWGLLPRGPQELKAEPGDRAVRLAWKPVIQLQNGAPLRDLAGYRVYRRTGPDAWQPVSPELLPQPAYQDVAVKNDVAYNYTVRAARRLGPDLLESADALAVAAMPEKLTPPPPLLNLVAVAGAQGIDLYWDPSPAPDLGGYRVYRRRAGESQFTRMNRDLLQKPIFSDNQVVKRQTYYYYVTAVDNFRRANESLPSEEAAITY